MKQFRCANPQKSDQTKVGAIFCLHFEVMVLIHVQAYVNRCKRDFPLLVFNGVLFVFVVWGYKNKNK